ncbi:MAG TPA: tRNA (adenosine(37)-N6)-threonylcarbamoyltransferase complex dimerization subunit type 1 TsaB [Polyangia bacterium]|nr:tRNA (adenosine(37)-N6)-threonylcarbamoyltransferase complex dimerization subunit type 1 TsaB [Polyangia bacterium]HVY36580.1 tRNA (adenosine(37)-N6)-threonylcarbamoyltransferase complex dimerization subunit type 1 TsaB [Polyangia bacterium]
MSSPPLFLCLDTSTPTARVAVIDAAAQVRFSAEVTADRHAGHLMPLCAQALQAAGVRAAGLAGIACGAGPGSFTGLRIGLAAAKGLAMPTGVPLYAVSSLEALALDILGAAGSGQASPAAIPCLDAGKGEVYVGAYATDGERLVRELAPPARLQPDGVAGWAAPLGPVVVAGNGAARHRERLANLETADVAGPTAVSVGRLALLQRARGEAADLASVVPFYGRPPDITAKKTPEKKT